MLLKAWMASDTDIYDEFQEDFARESEESEASFLNSPKTSVHYIEETQVKSEPGVVTEQHLKYIARELGLIKLCWDDIPVAHFDG